MSAAELRMTPFVVEREGEAVISLLLDTDKDYTGFQTEILLPEGLSFSADEDGYVKLGEVASSTHQITSNHEERNLRLVCFSTQNESLQHEGLLLSFRLNCDSGFTEGEVKIINTIFSDSDNQDITMPEITAPGKYISITRTPELSIIKNGTSAILQVVTEGGFSGGLSYEWTHDGIRISDEASLTVTGKVEGADPARDEYRVRITDSSEGFLLFDRSYSFTVETWPSPDTETHTTLSREKVRENETVSLCAVCPAGGYPDWRWEWFMDDSQVSDQLEFTKIMTMESGTAKQNDAHTFSFRAANYGPENDLWGETIPSQQNVTVYRRPKTPARLGCAREGNVYRLQIEPGIPGEEISINGYIFTVGYHSESGEPQSLFSGPDMELELEAESYRDIIEKLWCYSTWTYDDDSMVSSGLRHINGDQDEDFDASVFSDPSGMLLPVKDNTTIEIRVDNGEINILNLPESDICISLYNLNGETIQNKIIRKGFYAEAHLSVVNLQPALYLLKIATTETVVIRKFFLH